MKDNPERRPMVSAFLSGVFMGIAAPAFILTSLVAKPPKAGSAALADDWKKIGSDMSRAILDRTQDKKAA